MLDDSLRLDSGLDDVAVGGLVLGVHDHLNSGQEVLGALDQLKQKASTWVSFFALDVTTFVKSIA